MAGQSKLFLRAVTYNCYEIGHTWSSNCPIAICMFAAPIVRESFKLYTLFYIANFILKKEKVTKENLTNLVVNTLQSTCFLGSTGFFHLFFTCVIRHSLGKFYFSTAAFFPGFLASLVSVLIERKNRRLSLALYVANVATETLFRMLVTRGIFKPIPNGEVVIFSFAMALYMLHLKNRGSSDILSKFLNNEQRTTTPDHDSKYQVNFEDSKYTKCEKWVRKFWRNCVVHFQTMPRHNSCRHQHSCFYSCFGTLLKAFSIGLGINTTLSLLQLIAKYKFNLSSIRKNILNVKNMNLGLFIGSFTGIYKAVSCLLRWYSNGDENWHALPAGFLAGTSMLYYKTSTLSLYLLWRVIEIYYRAGIKSGHLPVIPGAIALLYATSCGILFHAAVVEPHNLKPTYYRFLQRVTGGLVDQVNRTLLSDVLPGSDTMFPNFFPNLDKSKMTADGIQSMRKRWGNF